MNSLKLYFRHALKNKIFSAITISSLAISMSVIILLSSFIISEFQYDKHLEDVDKIFRIGNSNGNAQVPEKARNQIIEQIPEITLATNYGRNNESVVFNENPINAQTIHTDENFFQIFNIKFISGYHKNIFEDPNNIVITESFSKRVFGDENPIGKILNISHRLDVRVAAIIKDFPKKSVLSGDMLCSTELKLSYSRNCSNDNCVDFYKTLVKLDNKATPNEITDKLTSIITSVHTFNKEEKLTYSLLPYKNAYFDTSLIHDDLKHANIDLIKLLIILTSVILGLSIFNFINLSISQITTRFKEFGIKQVFGANYKMIFRQFLNEAFFTMLFAFGIGLLLSYLLNPTFSEILGKQIFIKEIITSPVILIYFLLSLTLIAFISALYPALATLKYQPKEILSKSIIKPHKSFNFRNILNVLQYSSSILVIIALIVITKQIDFVKNKDLGFDKKHLVKIPVHSKAREKVDILTNRLQSIAGVKKVCHSHGIPGAIWNTSGNEEFKNISCITSDMNFVETFGLQIVQGRNILPQEQGRVCLINKKTMQQAEWKDFTGKKIFGAEIVGIVNDFHFKDLYHEIGGLMIENGKNVSHITIRLYPGDITNVMGQVKKGFKEILPDYEFDYQFYDEYFDSLYKQEEKIASAIKIIAIIAIFITCIGLFGSVEFSTRKRAKEVAIRKVNGAKTFQIILLLNKKFAKWVIFAFIISCPTAYYFLSNWLGNFKYKISLSWWIFIISGLSMLAIVLITASWRTWKAATNNPVKSLTSE